MRICVYLPLLTSLVLAGASRPLAARVAPAAVARALVIAVVAAATTSTWGLVLLAGTLAHKAPLVTERLREDGLTMPEPVPELVAASAWAALGVAVYRLAATVHARRAQHRRLRALCRDGGGSELVVVDAEQPHAVAVPGRPEHILVTSGMLRALDTDERRVLFAHERSHLDECHHMLCTLGALAAAVNPLLIPARSAITYLVERWADERAARHVASRDLTARALARAALAGTPEGAPSRLAFGDGAVPRRVRALGREALPPRWPVLAAVVLLALSAVFAMADATMDFANLAALVIDH